MMTTSLFTFGNRDSSCAVLGFISNKVPSKISTKTYPQPLSFINFSGFKTGMKLSSLLESTTKDDSEVDFVSHDVEFFISMENNSPLKNKY